MSKREKFIEANQESLNINIKTSKKKEQSPPKEQKEVRAASVNSHGS
jgi:hypothetical protein